MMCCFQQPIVAPSERAKNLTSILKVLVLIELVLAIMKMIFIGIIPGIYELIEAWMLCMAYSQMNFCTLVIYMFICMSNLVYAFTYVGWVIQFNKWKALSENGMAMTAFIIQVFAMAFYITTTYFCFLAYREYKALLFEQSSSAAQMMSYGLMPSGGGNSAPPAQQPQQQNARYDPPPQEEERRAAPRNQGGFSAFQGEGVRIGGN